ncbi:MAG: hypothetical protein ABL949_01760 [Fimbriimonadaceae bacterium]
MSYDFDVSKERDCNWAGGVVRWMLAVSPKTFAQLKADLATHMGVRAFEGWIEVWRIEAEMGRIVPTKARLFSRANDVWDLPHTLAPTGGRTPSSGAPAPLPGPGRDIASDADFNWGRLEMRYLKIRGCLTWNEAQELLDREYGVTKFDNWKVAWDTANAAGSQGDSSSFGSNFGCMIWFLAVGACSAIGRAYKSYTDPNDRPDTSIPIESQVGMAAYDFVAMAVAGILLAAGTVLLYLAKRTQGGAAKPYTRDPFVVGIVWSLLIVVGMTLWGLLGSPPLAYYSILKWSIVAVAPCVVYVGILKWKAILPLWILTVGVGVTYGVANFPRRDWETVNWITIVLFTLEAAIFISPWFWGDPRRLKWGGIMCLASSIVFLIVGLKG